MCYFLHDLAFLNPTNSTEVVLHGRKIAGHIAQGYIAAQLEGRGLLIVARYVGRDQ